MTTTNNLTDTGILGHVRDLIRDMATAMGRPAVIESESGIPSVKLNNLASGATQIEVRIYHKDPYEAARIANDIYEINRVYWAEHKPGDPNPFDKPAAS